VSETVNYTDMPRKKTNTNTGIFQTRQPPAIIVMWKGREICRYASIKEFVDSHLEGIAALELKQEQLLSDAYRDKL